MTMKRKEDKPPTGREYFKRHSKNIRSRERWEYFTVNFITNEMHPTPQITSLVANLVGWGSDGDGMGLPFSQDSVVLKSSLVILVFFADSVHRASWLLTKQNIAPSKWVQCGVWVMVAADTVVISLLFMSARVLWRLLSFLSRRVSQVKITKTPAHSLPYSFL